MKTATMMKTVSAEQAVTNPASIARLEEIQEEKRQMCEPHYDEFHKNVIEHGFIKITLPKHRN